MSVANAAELAGRQLALEYAVDELTLGAKVERPDGAGRGEVMSLLAALEDAETSTDGEALRSTTLGSVKAPARLSPLEVLVDVDRVVGRHARGRSSAVRAWAAREGSSPSLDVVDEAAQRAEGWVESIRAILEPRRNLALRGATCPLCGHDRVVALGNAGEPIVEPALVADLRTGVVSCLLDGCGASWAPDQLELLAEQLGRQTAAEALGL